MSIRCLTGVRFTMKATLLHRDDFIPDPIDPEQYGEWVESQDPLTGEIVRIWVPFENPDDGDPDIVTFKEIKCIARGVVDGGIRVAGTTEWYGQDYRNIDFVKLWVPAGTEITKRDRITNIKDAKGHVRWLDEEFDDPLDLMPPRATVFNVNGVTPLFDAWNRHVESYVMLERAEVATDA